MTRGEVYLYNRPSPQKQFNGILSPERIVIVSSNVQEAHNKKILGCLLYGNVSRDLPTHVLVRSTSKPMTVACEHIRTIPIDDLGAKIAELTPAEMAAVDIALAAALGLDFGKSDAKEREELAAALVAQKEEAARLREELADAKGELVRVCEAKVDAKAEVGQLRQEMDAAGIVHDTDQGQDVDDKNAAETAEQLRRALTASQDTVGELSDQISEMSEEITGHKFRADMLRAEVSELRSNLEAANRENERLSEMLGELETARFLHDPTDEEIERARKAAGVQPPPLDGERKAGEDKEPPAACALTAEDETRIKGIIERMEAAGLTPDAETLGEALEEIEELSAEVARLDVLLLEEKAKRERERAGFERVRAELAKEVAVKCAIAEAVSDHNVDLLNIITALAERGGREG